MKVTSLIFPFVRYAGARYVGLIEQSKNYSMPLSRIGLYSNFATRTGAKHVRIQRGNIRPLHISNTTSIYLMKSSLQ